MLHHNKIGKGPTIVLLHGFLEHSAMWNFLTDEESFQWLTIDLPGHGKSTDFSEEYTMKFLAQKCLEVIDHHAIQDFVVMGHSMGGYVALELYKLVPSRIQALGLFFSTPFADSIEKKENRNRSIDLVQENKDRFVELSIPLLFHITEENPLQEEVHTALSWAKTTTQDGIIKSLAGMRERQDNEEIMQMDFPKLVLSGEFDNAVPIHTIKDKIHKWTHTTHHILPIGHMGQLESPTKCRALLLNFIRNVKLL